MVPLKIKDKKINVALARTPLEQRRGLQHKVSMPQNEGMLFCHRKPHKMNYWMKDTYIPLSIAFITADGRISQIEDMEPGEENGASSNIPCQYALETNKGWFAKNNIRVGDSVDLPLFNMMEVRKKNKMNNTLFLDNYIKQNLLSEQASANPVDIVKNLINIAKTAGPKAAKFSEETIGRAGGIQASLRGATQEMKNIILAFFKIIQKFLTYVLEDEVFYNVSFREAAKRSDSALAQLFRNGIKNSTTALGKFTTALSRIFNSVAAFIEAHGARLFVRVFGESITAMAKPLLRFIPWVWIGKSIYSAWIAPFISNPLTGNKGEFAAVDIFDSEGDFFLAWTNSAKATSNPANNPGQRMMRMAREDYDGPFYAKEWHIWPEPVQIAFCQQNQRQPRLQNGDFPSKGPTCEQLESKNPKEFQGASFPEDLQPKLMSTEEGEAYTLNYSKEKENKSMSESRIISEDEFIPAKKIMSQIDVIVDQVTSNRAFNKKIKAKLKDIITQGTQKADRAMGMEKKIIIDAAKGMLSKLKDNPKGKL